MAEGINLEDFLLKNCANLKELAEKVMDALKNVSAVPALIYDVISTVGGRTNFCNEQEYLSILTSLEDLRIKGAYGAIAADTELRVHAEAPLNAIISFNLHTSKISVQNLPASEQTTLYEDIKGYLVEDSNG